MMVLDLVFGLLLVFAGRNLFWLCVGIIGFLIGVQCALLLGFSNGWMVMVSALGLGSIGAVLAMSFEWLMVIFGVGFLGGGYLLMNMLPSTIGLGPYAWPVFVVGGIVGVCLMVIAFDWTLILISSLLGATLIVGAFHGSGQIRDFLFIASMLTGIVVQSMALKGMGDQERSARRK